MTIYVLDTFSGSGDLSTHVGEVGAAWTGEAAGGPVPDLTLVQIDPDLGAHLESVNAVRMLVCSGNVLTTEDVTYKIVFTVPPVGSATLAGVTMAESYDGDWDGGDQLICGWFMQADRVLKLFAGRVGVSAPNFWHSGNINTGLGPGTYTLQLELTQARTRARLLLNGVERYAATVAALPLPMKTGLQLNRDTTPTTTYLSHFEIGTCPSILTDAFIGTNGTLLPAHTPDVVPSGFSWHDRGPSELMQIGTNRAVSSAPGGGFASIYNAGETSLPGLTLPYKVTFVGYCDGLDSGNGTLLHLDGPGDISQIAIDLHPTSLYVFVGNDLPTTFDYAEETYVVSSGVAHTVELLIEADQFTVTIDSVTRTAVAMSGGSAPADAAYVNIATNATASYVDYVAICLGVPEEQEEPPEPPATNPALPLITMPSGLPTFLAEGHGIDEDSVYAQVPFTTGHSRARRVWTVTERAVTVGLFLEPDEMATFEEWYESTLLAGTRLFAAQVRNQGEGSLLLWWTARWINLQTEMRHLGRGKVTGTLLLTGEGSEAGPEFGVLAQELRVPLLDVSSLVGVPHPLALEVGAKLMQAARLRMELSVPLLMDYFATGARITEDEDTRVTEAGDLRITEA